MRVLSTQAPSAAREFNAAGVRHDDEVKVEVTVGATPPNYGAAGVTAMLHFCSSRVKLIERIRKGDGKMIEAAEGYRVNVVGEVPTLSKPSLVRFLANAHPNGSLTITPATRQCVAVAIPEDLHIDRPWAFRGGDLAVANRLGCDTVDEVFEKHGQLVNV